MIGMTIFCPFDISTLSRNNLFINCYATYRGLMTTNKQDYQYFYSKHYYKVSVNMYIITKFALPFVTSSYHVHLINI